MVFFQTFLKEFHNMGKYNNISEDQLRAFAKEHLYYEISMLYYDYDQLKVTSNRDFLFSALLESLIIHTTVLLDFFYKPQMKADDAKAIHYMKDIAAWKKVLPNLDPYFRKFYTRRSKEVVHLSYRRLDVSQEEKSWQGDKTTQNLKETINIFLHNADPGRLDPILNEFKY